MTGTERTLVDWPTRRSVHLGRLVDIEAHPGQRSLEVLDRVIDEIQKVKYLHNVVIALGGASEEADNA